MSARTAGMVKIVGGLVLTIVTYVLVLTVMHVTGGRKAGAVLILGPLVALVGLFELLSGVGCRDWVAQWPALPGWLKALIALVAVVALLVLIIGTVVMVR